MRFSTAVLVCVASAFSFGPANSQEKHLYGIAAKTFDNYCLHYTLKEIDKPDLITKLKEKFGQDLLPLDKSNAQYVLGTPGEAFVLPIGPGGYVVALPDIETDRRCVFMAREDLDSTALDIQSLILEALGHPYSDSTKETPYPDGTTISQHKYLFGKDGGKVFLTILITIAKNPSKPGQLKVISYYTKA